MKPDQLRVLVVGAGVIGSHIALAAVNAGHQVQLIDRELLPTSASRLNLGVVRLSGRRLGREMELARAGRSGWESVALKVPDVGFRASGSVTVLENESEVAFAEEYVTQVRGILSAEIIPGSRLSSIEPAVTGSFPAAMVTHDDAWIRPGRAVGAIVEHLQADDHVTVRLGTRLLALRPAGGTVIADTTCGPISADKVFVCTGEHAVDLPEVVAAQSAASAQLHSVRLHTTIGRSTTPPRAVLMDASTFRLHAGFTDLARPDTLPSQPVRHPAEWVVSPTAGGSLLVGAIRSTDLGVPLPLDDGVLRWLEQRTETILGVAPSTARPRTFSATVLECQGRPYVTMDINPQTTVVTGQGQRGNTLAPAIAAELVSALG